MKLSECLGLHLVENCGIVIPISRTERDTKNLIYKSVEHHQFVTKSHLEEI